MAKRTIPDTLTLNKDELIKLDIFIMYADQIMVLYARRYAPEHYYKILMGFRNAIKPLATKISKAAK